MGDEDVKWEQRKLFIILLLETKMDKTQQSLSLSLSYNLSAQLGAGFLSTGEIMNCWHQEGGGMVAKGVKKKIKLEG